MRVIYSLVIILYTGLIHIASLFNTKASLWVKGRRGWKEKLNGNFNPGDKTIWVHCASLGEFEQGRPVIELIKEKAPEYRILVTFFSPSGYEIRKNWAGADHICYLPPDTNGNAMKFIEIVKPSFVLFIKYEFWNNYISELNKRKIPLFLISAIFRTDQPFFRWYGSFFRNMLRKFTHIFVQDDRSQELLKKIGITEVSVSGDTRFDRVKKIAETAKELPLIETFRNGEKVFIAGSSWHQDEEIISKFINCHPARMKWIFAPHEIERANIARLESLITVKCERYSGPGENLADARVLIIDNIGMLSSIYRYASVAAVGGGFGKGIHNILEPACWGIPVLFGPEHLKFREATELLEKGGSFCFRNYEDFERIFEKLSSDKELYETASETAKNYILNNIGATEKIVALITGGRY
jgi:3-deoxy-D-manno-octulosonic-acid transferase